MTCGREVCASSAGFGELHLAFSPWLQSACRALQTCPSWFLGKQHLSLSAVLCWPCKHLPSLHAARADTVQHLCHRALTCFDTLSNSADPMRHTWLPACMQDMRVLELSPSDTYGADEAVQALSAWPRGLPPSARITLVRLTGPIRVYPDALTGLSPLLARAKHVEWHAVTVHCGDVAECLPLPRAVLRVVYLNVPHPAALYENVGLRLAVAGPGTGDGGAGGGGGEPRDGAAAAAAKPATAAAAGEPAAAPGALPMLDDVLVRAVEVMQERALADAALQEQRPALLQAPRGPGVRGHGGRAAAQGHGGIWAAVSDDTDCPVERWWRAGKESEGQVRRKEQRAGGVVLLSGPGVLALAAHSTEAGEAALKAALEGLSRSHPGARQHRAYQVLPGGGGVLLQWGGGDVAEAAAQAVLAVAQELGLEVPAGGVRAVALPHHDLATACVGLYAGVWQVGC